MSVNAATTTRLSPDQMKFLLQSGGDAMEAAVHADRSMVAGDVSAVATAA